MQEVMSKLSKSLKNLILCLQIVLCNLSAGGALIHKFANVLITSTVGAKYCSCNEFVISQTGFQHA